MSRLLQFVVTILMLIILSVTFGSLFYNVSALSPSFSRNILQDDSSISGGNSEAAADDNLTENEFADIPIDIETYSGSVDEYNSTSEFDNLPIDILLATSVSDGKFLNGTLWLSTPIYKERHLDYVDSNLNFSMYIWPGDNPDAAYYINIYPKRDGTWTKVIWEDEPYHPVSDIYGYTNRTLETIHNYTGFFENGDRYVDLSLDLSTIGFPDNYIVNFGAYANKDGISLDDFPPTATVVPNLMNVVEYGWPNILNPINLKSGEVRSIDILVNSTQLYIDAYHHLSDANKTDSITLNFDPASIYVPENGLSTTKLIIKAAENVSDGRYTLPVQIDTLTTEGIRGSYNETLDIEILPPSPPVEQFSNVVQANSIVSASMPLVITSIVGLGLVRFINTKSSSFALSSLKSAEVLAIDASIIVGVLIFLTIGGAEFGSNNVNLTTNSATNLDSLENSNDSVNQANNLNLTVGLLTASIVYPFAISAIRVVIKGSAEPGLKFMIIGFVYLMIAVVIIAFLNQ